VGTNLLIQGKKTLENRTNPRYVDSWNFTITKLTDVKIVQAQSYYTKIKGVFSDITSMMRIPMDKREGLLTKAQNVIDEDLIVGNRVDVYMNDQVVRQFSKAGIRAKSDSLETTSDFMKGDEREALNYIENAIKENDFNLDVEYIYDDYISQSVNRGLLL
jgi:hypothetical protein